MRSFSLFLTLLLAIPGLAAQSPGASAPAQFALPAGLRSCPVRLSVDRRPEAGLIWTSSLNDWAKRHSNLSLEDQQRALQAEPGFRNLSPQEQKNELDQLAQFYHNNPAHQSQGLKITISRPETRIITADIVVYGYPAGVHAIPANALAPREITESFHLTPSDGHPEIDSSIWTRQMAMINRIEITRLEYADGTTWQPTVESRCTAAPSLLVLVDSAIR